MSSLRFAYKALVRVYMEDLYNPAKLCYESITEELMTASHAYDGDDEREFLLDQMDWEEPGYFSVWIMGTFEWSQDYWGEWDMNIEPDVQVIRHASEQEMEMVTGFKCYHDNTPATDIFTFTS